MMGVAFLLLNCNSLYSRPLFIFTMKRSDSRIVYAVFLLLGICFRAEAFVPLSTPQPKSHRALWSSAKDDVCTIQILMSDTGGGHRASANALRDAFDLLHPGKIECDIVDLYTDYGNIWPYTDYPALYKIMAKYSFLWDAFYHFGSTPFGLALNAFLQELFCFDSFRECLDRPSGSTGKRADMVLSVHPLCQDIPLRALANLDSKGETRDPQSRSTPFVTVVTDLGGVSQYSFSSY